MNEKALDDLIGYFTEYVAIKDVPVWTEGRKALLKAILAYLMEIDSKDMFIDDTVRLLSLRASHDDPIEKLFRDYKKECPDSRAIKLFDDYKENGNCLTEDVIILSAALRDYFGIGGTNV